TPRKTPCREAGRPSSCDRLLCSVDRRLEFRSGLLRLIAVVEGEQRLPGRAEMVVPEAFERLRPLRRERLDLLIAPALALITLGIELRPVQQPVARRSEAD